MGGGSDYPAYYNHHGGEVLSVTIAKYCHVLLRRMPPFLGSKYRVFWSQSEAVDRVEDIQHSGVRGCLQYLEISDGIEVNHAGDLPARSGLGSSSAFTVGMLHALHVLRGHYPSRVRLADEAIAVEQQVLAETVGVQDQIACAWGGVNVVKLARNGDYDLHALKMSDDAVGEIEGHLMLLWTGVQRYASEIASTQIKNMRQNEGKIAQLVELVPYCVEAMKLGDARMLGDLLGESWKIKRELSDRMTTTDIDDIYTTAMRNGATGGKVLGAGGGGFLLICAPPKSHSKIAGVTRCLTVPVKFEYRGSSVVLAES